MSTELILILSLMGLIVSCLFVQIGFMSRLSTTTTTSNKSEVSGAAAVSTDGALRVALAEETLVGLADGTTVELAGNTTVALNTPVQIAANAKVGLADNASVTVKGTVQLADDASVSVGGTVALAANTAVGVTGQVTLVPNQSVIIANEPLTINIASDQYVTLANNEVAVVNVPHVVVDTMPEVKVNVGDITLTDLQIVSGTLTNITNPVHVIADSGTITTVTAVTGITNAVHVIADSGTISTVTAVTDITNPIHVIADSGTITTVSAVTGITNPVHVIADSGTITTVSTVTALTSITNPVTVTGTLTGITNPVTVTGTLTGITNAVHVIADSGTITAVTDITNPIHVIADSGTITTVSAVTGITNPVHVIADSGTITTVTALTSITNPVTVTGTLTGITNPVTVTGSLTGITNPISVTGTLTGITNPVNVVVNSGTVTAVTSITNPVTVTGTLTGITNPVSVTGTLTGITNPVTVTGITNPITSTFTGGNADAFGRLRVSTPITIFDQKFITDNAPLVWDDQQTSGTGTTSTFNANQASITLTVGTGAGVRTRQTFRRFRYQPGKSQLILMTGVLGAMVAGNTSSIGLFDDRNGVFFSNISGVVNVVRRTFVTGSAVDTAVPQSSWNLDTMNGLGASGITLDYTKTQIFVIDFQWLGVGRVRFGVVVNGLLYYVHQMVHANVLSVVYMSLSDLPIRYQISNVSSSTSQSLVQICCCVMSEGGLEWTKTLRSLDRGVTPLQVASTNTNTAIFFRLKSTHLHATVEVQRLTVLCSTTCTYRWTLVFNPTITPTPVNGNFTALSNSAVEYNNSATLDSFVATGGTIIDAGYGVDTAQSASYTISSNYGQFVLGSSIAGVSDIIALCVTRISGTTEDFYATLNFIESF